MKFLLLGVVISFALISCDQSEPITDGGFGASSNVELATYMDSVSYSIGNNIGSSFAQDSLEISYNQFLAGVRDALEGNEKILSDEEIGKVLASFQATVEQKRMSQQFPDRERIAKLNQEQGQSSIEEYASQPGVKKADNGIYYKVIEEGTGGKLDPQGGAKFNMIGKYIDGTEFENTYNNGQPLMMPIQALGVEGMIFAVANTPIGGTYEYMVPAELAYAEEGMGPIPPNSNLILQIEVIEKMDPSQMQPPPMPQGGMPQGGMPPMPQ